eukprot:9381821-Ditylum_brightwellii.AAC.1
MGNQYKMKFSLAEKEDTEPIFEFLYQVLDKSGPEEKAKLTIGGVGGNPGLTRVAASNEVFSSLGTSDNGKKDAKSDDDARDGTTTNTISAEEWEVGPTLLLSTNDVNNIIKDNFVCGLCINEEEDLISDRIGKDTTSLVPKNHKAVDRIVDEEKRSEAEQWKLCVVMNHIGCSSKVRVKC